MKDIELLADETEALRRVEERIASIKRENDRLAYRLTRQAELRRFAFLGAALAFLAAGASYVTAARGASCHAYDDDRDHAARLHEDRMADERAVEEACVESSRKVSADLSQCQQARTRADFNSTLYDQRFARPPTF